MVSDPPPDRKAQLKAFVLRARDKVARWVPPGLRWVAGMLLVVGGILGFLPILGFWMIPLGLAVAALDIGPLWRWISKRRKRMD